MDSSIRFRLYRGDEKLLNFSCSASLSLPALAGGAAVSGVLSNIGKSF